MRVLTQKLPVSALLKSSLNAKTLESPNASPLSVNFQITKFSPKLLLGLFKEMAKIRFDTVKKEPFPLFSSYFQKGLELLGAVFTPFDVGRLMQTPFAEVSKMFLQEVKNSNGEAENMGFTEEDIRE
jgi:hypothetical protein